MQIESDNIRGFKLNAGVEIIAEVEEETPTSFKLKKALFWQLTQVAETKYDILFFPLSDGLQPDEDGSLPAIDAEIYKSSILVSYKIRPEIKERYKQNVSPIMLLQ